MYNTYVYNEIINLTMKKIYKKIHFVGKIKLNFLI